jgi:beta-aspartyl-peptidase (threonine type)
MKVVLSKTVCDLFLQNDAIIAAQKGISILKNRVNGMGGVIGINNRGEYAFAYNTPKMAFAFAHENGDCVSHINSIVRAVPSR